MYIYIYIYSFRFFSRVVTRGTTVTVTMHTQSRAFRVFCIATNPTPYTFEPCRSPQATAFAATAVVFPHAITRRRSLARRAPHRNYEL